VHPIVWLVASGMLQQPPLGPVLPPAFASVTPALTARDTGQGQRPPRAPRAIEYSNFYTLRATIHRDASYATLPLFVAEYAIGRSLYNKPPGSTSSSLRSAHGVVAAGIGGLFALNTVTGGWNLWDARKDPAGRTRRYIHSALMFVSGAGFVATGALAPDDDTLDPNRRSLHRTVAIASMSTALAGYLMMLIWKD
jgi:hypothetical protein